MLGGHGACTILPTTHVVPGAPLPTLWGWHRCQTAMHIRGSHGRVNPPPGRAAFVDNIAQWATLPRKLQRPEEGTIRYIGGRVLQAFVTLVLFMIILFVATRSAGDPALLILPA